MQLTKQQKSNLLDVIAVALNAAIDMAFRGEEYGPDSFTSKLASERMASAKAAYKLIMDAEVTR